MLWNLQPFKKFSYFSKSLVQMNFKVHFDSLSSLRKHDMIEKAARSYVDWYIKDSHIAKILLRKYHQKLYQLEFTIWKCKLEAIDLSSKTKCYKNTSRRNFIKTCKFHKLPTVCFLEKLPQTKCKVTFDTCLWPSFWCFFTC